MTDSIETSSVFPFPSNFQDLSLLEKHSIVLFGHRTSITLERIFWVDLQHYAQEQKLSLQKIIEMIDTHRTGSLSSAIRVWLMSQRKQHDCDQSASPSQTETTSAERTNSSRKSP